MVTPLRLADIDLTDLDNFGAGFPHRLFEVHRAEAPVWWHAPTRHTPDGEGFWSVATYDEVLQVLKEPERFSSERGGSRPYGGTLIQDLPIAGVVLNMMDDPRHPRIRRLVSTGLTPRTIGRLEDELRRRTRALLDRVDDGRPCDFLLDVAAELPMQAICILLGIPEEDRHTLFAAIEPTFDIRGGGDVLRPSAEAAAGQAYLFDYGSELIKRKRRQPTDDMLSVVVHATLADVDPSTLSDGELYAFFALLFAAGAETTRNAIAGGLLALIEHPAALGRLRADPGLLGRALEEMLRWTTPSPAKRRTATRPVVLGGEMIQPGDKVVVWEGSANRDERVFTGSQQFDVGRDPNPHLAFGHGIHFCLGANLARLEMRVVFEELLPAFRSFEPAGPVEWTRSNRHTGIRHLPLRLRRA
jgi:cytochrome P450